MLPRPRSSAESSRPGSSCGNSIVRFSSFRVSLDVYPPSGTTRPESSRPSHANWWNAWPKTPEPTPRRTTAPSASAMSSRMSSSRRSRNRSARRRAQARSSRGTACLITGLSSSFRRSVTANAVAVATSSPATRIVGAQPLQGFSILELGAMAKLLLSFDFEDWHQLVHRGLGRTDWDQRGHALERQTAAIFDLLDELGAKATFFVLGMTAERYPDLVREIAAQGHELACHGYAHERVPTQSRDEFRADVERCAELLEQLGGQRPARLPGARVLDHARHAVGLRRPRRARLPLRLEPVRLAADPPADQPRAAGALPARAPLRPRDLGVPDHRLARSRPRRCRSAAAPTGASLPAAVLRRALREVADENAYPVLYFHPYELDPQPLRAELPESPTPRQRLLAAWKSVQRNPGRRRVADRIRAIAREYPLASYEEAHGEVVERYGARPRSLSREGVLV